MSKAKESAPFRGGLVKCVLALTIALFWSAPAAAQATCAPVKYAKAEMTKAGGKVVAVMIAYGKVVEIWAQPDGSNFVMFFINDEGEACPLLAGSDIHVLMVPGRES